VGFVWNKHFPTRKREVWEPEACYIVFESRDECGVQSSGKHNSDNERQHKPAHFWWIEHGVPPPGSFLVVRIVSATIRLDTSLEKQMDL
jgi:hypothetical protein